MTPHSTRVPPQPGETFLYASDSGPNISWLVAALQRRGVVVPVTTPCAATLDERIAALNPQAVFLDFSGEQVARAAVLHEQLKRDWPALAVVGTGSSGEPAAMLAALRAGVDDFVDVAAATADVNATLGALLERRSIALSRVRGRTVALLGARAGLGVSTLAANLTVLLQDTLARRTAGTAGKAEPARGAALLDLGLPARDGLALSRHAEHVQFRGGGAHLRRLDHTLVRTAVAHHAGGAAVLPWPASLAQVRDISHADSATLIRRLADFFDYQVADLGGFSSIDFIAQRCRRPTRPGWYATRASAASFSTATLLRELQERASSPSAFRW